MKKETIHKEVIKKELLTLEQAINMERREIKEKYRQFINPSMADMLGMIGFDKKFVRAEAEKVWDAEGNLYLDFLGAYGALNLGHNPLEVQKAVADVFSRPNLMQASLNPLAAALAHNLAQVTPGDLERVFFCNSGTEAVEGALKLARAANPGRSRIVYCLDSFHGKSFGSLSVTGREKYQKPFRPLLPDCEAVPFGDLEALTKVLQKEDTAAFIVEPIQGEGGVKVPPQGYLSEARKLCDTYGTFLIADEVQTGMGRTGRMFACEHEGIVPDILCLAKSLGGGVMPLGAYIARRTIWDKAYLGADKFALHTSTFGGNTLAAAAGLAALQSLTENNLSAVAEEKGAYFISKLKELQQKYSLIREVRGRGLLIGLEFAEPAKGTLNKITRGKVNRLAEEYFASLVAGQLINKHRIITAYTLNNPNVIRLEPPLVVSWDSLEKAVNSLEKILAHSGFGGIMINGVRTAFNSVLN